MGICMVFCYEAGKGLKIQKFALRDLWMSSNLFTKGKYLESIALGITKITKENFDHIIDDLKQSEFA
jgi:hypothetical protein